MMKMLKNTGCLLMLFGLLSCLTGTIQAAAAPVARAASVFKIFSEEIIKLVARGVTERTTSVSSFSIPFSRVFWTGGGALLGKQFLGGQEQTTPTPITVTQAVPTSDNRLLIYGSIAAGVTALGGLAYYGYKRWKK